jgi:hypothetical protein
MHAIGGYDPRPSKIQFLSSPDEEDYLLTTPRFQRNISKPMLNNNY